MQPFEPTGLGATIFNDRYARFEGETWQQACKRVATHVAMAEENGKVKSYGDRFYDELVNNRFNPGGRIGMDREGQRPNSSTASWSHPPIVGRAGARPFPMLLSFQEPVAVSELIAPLCVPVDRISRVPEARPQALCPLCKWWTV
jgi:hypothetical protein